ncbi:hypothetical protein NQ315_006882 [Exocentrus adspersus]|uniref:Uncharacterized protein n=1 Tax=Exocentrus adspersus TaxID=1586481 RepID=A0AAV8WBS0_9CUCU|nr:hypothetical protein NQ315_006882 [Exocentrus adspersus]
MKNHYRKLRSAKSTIDNTFPQSFSKTFSTPPGSGRSSKRIDFEERCLKHNSSDRYRVTKHNCVTSMSGTSDTSINTLNLPLRPRSRRNPMDGSIRIQCKPRSHSVALPIGERPSGKIKKKRKVTRKYPNSDSTHKLNTSGLEDKSESEEQAKSDSNRSIASKEVELKSSKSKVQEHEYLQFLLRITEEIIVNDLYTNEDIEKVFETHIEANKDHLNVEKMEAHLVRLCQELEIPYKNKENGDSNGGCYEKFFNQRLHTSDCQQKPEDCECQTKRTLPIEIKKSKQNVRNGDTKLNGQFELQTIYNLLTNKYSLGRVTECTEPNSLETLIETVKQSSVTGGLSLDNVSVFACLENLEKSETRTKEKLPEREETASETDDSKCLLVYPQVVPTTISEIALTEKEKLGCVEEEILYKKWKENLVNQMNNCTELSDHAISVENKSDNSNTSIIANFTEHSSAVEANQIDGESKSSVTADNNSNKIEHLSLKTVVEEPKRHSLENSDNDAQLECNRNDSVHTVKHTSLSKVPSVIVFDENATKIAINDSASTSSLKSVQEKIQAYNLLKEKTSSDQSTQIEPAAHSDKECNTSLDLKEYSNSDYVLINGPVYVLKAVLESHEKFVIYDKDNANRNKSPNDVEEIDAISPEKLPNGKVFDPQFSNYISSYFKNDFSKLLNSDYDLTPERDSDTSVKYHHLLADATTSISNVNLNSSVDDSYANPDALLLGDNYELCSRLQEDLVPDTHDLINHGLNNSAAYSFQNELSMDGQYELRSYSLPKEINSSVNITGEEGVNDTELDVSLKNYELCSSSVTNRSDVSESGEIGKGGVCKEEDVSEASTFG